MESVLYSPNSYISPGRELAQKLLRTVQIVAEAILDAQALQADLDIFLPGIYVISISLAHLKTPISRTDVPSLLPQLIKAVSIPITKREISISQQTLRVISAIVSQDASQAFLLTKSTAVWEQLVICDDFWIRWLAFNILKHISYHLLRDERNRIFSIVRNDIEERLQTTPLTAFVDRDWKDLIDTGRLEQANYGLPQVVLTQEIDADIAASGIRQLLEAAPEAAFSTTSINGPEDFPWLYRFDEWIRSSES